MKKNAFFFLILLLILLSSCFNVSKAETILKKNQTFTTNKDLFKPFKSKNTNPNIQANIASSVLLNNNNKIILYEKNLNEKTSIASLSKLMTAVIVLDHYPLDSKILVDKEMMKVWGTSRNIQIGDYIEIKDLLYIMLLESNNDASECLSAKLNRSNFIILMNEKAKQLKMKQTSFVNPSGLDEDNGTYNVSSAKDLTLLIYEIIGNYPEIVEILSKKEYDFINENGIIYKIKNTNIMLEEFSYKAWGKTGYTLSANECLILMTKTPLNDTIINIVIKANNRFLEMRNLITWVNNTFSF